MQIYTIKLRLPLIHENDYNNIIHINKVIYTYYIWYNVLLCALICATTLLQISMVAKITIF